MEADCVGYPVRDFRCLRNKTIIIHKAKENTLSLLDSSFNVIKEIKGYPDDKYIFEDSELKCFRSTGDDRRFLWYKGKATMSVVDSSNLEEQEYRGFWMDGDKKREITNNHAIASKDCSKIFAMGILGGGPVLIYQNSITAERVLRQNYQPFFEKISEILCLESAANGSDDYFFVGGIYLDTPTIMSVKFDASLVPITNNLFQKVKSKSLTKIKRVDGSDVLILGMMNEIFVMKYDKNTFTQWAVYNTYCDIEICSIAFHSNLIFTLTVGECSLHVIEFKSAVNQSVLNDTENRTPLKTNLSQLAFTPETNPESPTSLSKSQRLLPEAMEDSKLSITSGILEQQEDKLAERLKNSTVIKHEAKNSPIYHLTANSFEKTLYCATDKCLDLYYIRGEKVVYDKTLLNVPVHSVFSVGTMTVVQEHYTNNLTIYNLGKIYRTFKGVGPSPAKGKLSSLIEAESDKLFEVKPTFGGTSFLWRCTVNSLNIMQINDLDKAKQINPFFDPAETPINTLDILTIVENIKPQKILGLAFVKGIGFILRTYQYDKGNFRTFSFSSHNADLELKSPNYEIVSIDKCQRTNIFFAGLNMSGGPCKCQVMAVKISTEGLSSGGVYQIKVESFTRINRITSVQSGKLDYVLVSGSNSVIMLKSKEKALELLHVFDNIIVGQVTDTCAFRSSFFCSSSDSQFIAEIRMGPSESSMDIDDKSTTSENEKGLYHNYNMTKIPIAKGRFEKLDINKNGTVLYLIGQGIITVENAMSPKPECSKTTMIPQEQILLVKTLRNGNIMYIESKNNDIVEITPQFKEMKRRKGVKGIATTSEELRTTRHSYDEITLPWMKGQNHLVLITLKDFSFKDSNNFFFGTKEEEDLMPVCAVSSQNGDRIFGMSLVQEQVRLSYMEKSENPKYSKLKEICPRFGIVLSIEVDLEDSTLFIGGSTSFDYTGQKASAILQATTFDKKLGFIADLKIDDRDNKYISKIRRIEGTNRFFSATVDAIYVQEFKNRKFYKLSAVLLECSPTANIIDLVYYKGTLFSLIAGDSEVYRIEFASH